MTEDQLTMLEDLVEDFSEDDKELSVALSGAIDCVAFAENMASMFESLGVLNKGQTYDSVSSRNDILMHSTNIMNNELTAAVIFLSGLNMDISTILRNSAAAFEKHNKDLTVGSTVARGYRDLADHVDRVRVLREAAQNQALTKAVSPSQEKTT